uniref:Uncharacterized protein n=2 Tax=Spironucleus salmonicida TaxID=348837 RepID=V6LYV5_9EUKA|eukprot:EST46009.1 Hypothetical protein SS50377_13995 [Spironucleus salmonicida]
MRISNVFGYNQLSEDSYAILNDKLFIINEYIIEIHSANQNKKLSDYSFGNMDSSFKIIQLQAFNDKIFVLLQKNKNSIIFEFYQNVFQQVQIINERCVQFLVLQQDGIVSFLFKTITGQIFQQMSNQKKEIIVKGLSRLQNIQFLSLLVLDNSFIDLNGQFAIDQEFPSCIRQIVYIQDRLYILLFNNHVYGIERGHEPVLIIDYDVLQFPIAKLLAFHGVLFFVTTKLRLYYLTEGPKIINIGAVRDTELEIVVFAAQLEKQILLSGKNGKFIVFNPTNKEMFQSNSNSRLLPLEIEHYDPNSMVLNYQPAARYQGFVPQGYWQLLLDNGRKEFLFQNFEKQNRCSIIDLSGAPRLEDSQHAVVDVVDKMLMLFYSPDGHSLHYAKCKGKDKIFKQFTCSIQIQRLYMSKCEDKVFVADINNNLKLLDFTQIPESKLIQSFRNEIVFVEAQPSYILIGSGMNMYICCNLRTVDIFKLQEIPSACFIANPTDHLGHQIIALAYQNGIIELRHLMSFTLLQQVSILNRKLSQLAIVNQQLRCEDAETRQIFILDKVSSLDNMLLDFGLV